MGKQKKETPKPYQVRLSVNALQNINEITGYITFINNQPLNAIKVGNNFNEVFIFQLMQCLHCFVVGYFYCKCLHIINNVCYIKIMIKYYTLMLSL